MGLAFFYEWFEMVYTYNKIIMQCKQGKEVELGQKCKWRQNSKPGKGQGQVASAHV